MRRRRGSGCVYYVLNRDRWYARWFDDGVRRGAAFPTREAAEMFLAMAVGDDRRPRRWERVLVIDPPAALGTVHGMAHDFLRSKTGTSTERTPDNGQSIRISTSGYPVGHAAKGAQRRHASRNGDLRGTAGTGDPSNGQDATERPGPGREVRHPRAGGIRPVMRTGFPG